MSTETVDLSTLVAHVPVDRFDIVGGPGAVKCMAVQERLYANPRAYVELVFTLKTAASTDTFRRTLKMATIFAVEGNTFNFFVLQLLLFFTVAPVALFFGISMDGLDSLVTVAIGVIFGLGFIWFIRAMARGPMGIAAPIVNSSTIVTLLVSLAFFGVSLSTTAVFALMLVGVGAVLLTFTRDTFKGRFLYSETTRLAAIAMIVHGVSFAFLTPIIERHEWYEVLFMMEFGMLLAAAAIMCGKFAKKTGELKILFTKQIIVAVIAGVITGLGSIIMFLAGGIDDNLVLPFVLTSASPLVTSIIAYFLDKERISLVNRIGAVVVVLGMVVLNL